MKHDWYLDYDGKIDVWRMSEGYCNGPECRRCGWIGCEHCAESYYDRDIYEEECPNLQLDLPL